VDVCGCVLGFLSFLGWVTDVGHSLADRAQLTGDALYAASFICYSERAL